MKFLHLIWILVGFVVCSSFGRWKAKTDIDKRRISLYWASKFARQFFKRFGIDLHETGIPYHPAPDCGCLVVANHLSYLDVLAIYAVLPAVFVTSVEVQKSPIQGLLARLAGSIFIERRKKWNLKNELMAIQEAMRNGFPVVVFPEGTSTDGTTTLPFKSGLFDAMRLEGGQIHPVHISYWDFNGRPLDQDDDLKNRVYYYGHMQLFPHLIRLALAESFMAEVHFLPPIKAEPQTSRKVLASESREAIMTSAKMATAHAHQ